MGTLVVTPYSDEEMFCPGTYYAGYKAPWLKHAGDATRPLSDPITGEPEPGTLEFLLNDPVSRFREQIVSPIDRYWKEPLSFWMTSRDNRRVQGTAFNVFQGLISDAMPTFPLGWTFTLTDIFTKVFLNDENRQPWRTVGDGFLSLLDSISEHLDRKQTEPIIYGRHTRVAGEVSAQPSGWAVQPIYLGIQTVGGTQRHCWLVAGHACTSVTLRVDGATVAEGSHWLIAGQANWLSQFGAPYVDYPSSTFGVDRRYALIYGDFGEEIPDKCATGDMLLEALVEGIEDAGDGSGELITDIYEQYRHYWVNYLANPSTASYQSGPWLTSNLVDHQTFIDASTIASLRRPGGLQGAAAIGLRGRGVSPSQIIANWNRSAFVRSGITTPWTMGIVQMHPTAEIKAAAPLYTDTWEILKQSFSTAPQWRQQATVVEYRGDYQHETGTYTSDSFVYDQDAVTNYGANFRIEVEYPYLPGEEQIIHASTLLLRMLVHKPILVQFDQTIGEGADDNWLAYRNGGHYIRYLHFDAVGGRSERLAQVITPIIRCSARRSACVAFDCEDLIGFDEPTEEVT